MCKTVTVRRVNTLPVVKSKHLIEPCKFPDGPKARHGCVRAFMVLFTITSEVLAKFNFLVLREINLLLRHNFSWRINPGDSLCCRYCIHKHCDQVYEVDYNLLM